MNTRGAENLLNNHLTDNENHNYISRIVAEEDNVVQVSGDGKYHTLTLVPMPTGGSDETRNDVEEQKETQKGPNHSESDHEEVGIEKGLSFGEDESLCNNLTESGNKYRNNMMWEDLRPKFYCTSCNFGSNKRYLLLRHLKTHERQNRNSEKIDCVKDEEEPLADVVKQCSNKYDVDTDEDELKRTFECNQCNYNTNRKYLLLRHARTHSGDRPYKCKICERGFSTGSSLQAHINMHYGVKKKKCKYCSTSFTTSGELQRHLKYKHTGEKPHKCNECDYAAVERSKLLRHKRYHSGERPYQCQHCTYASHDTSQLRRHTRKHTYRRKTL